MEQTDINKGSYAWEQVDATEISRPSGGQGMPDGESGQGGPGGPGGESGQGGPGDLNFGPRTSSVNETNSNSQFLDFSSLLLLFILF